MHNSAMRNHADIIRAAGEDAIAAATKAPVNTIRSWVQRNRIPAPQWAALVDAGICTADELMDAIRLRAA